MSQTNAVEPEIVAYRHTVHPGILLCRKHGFRSPTLTPLTSDDLPDGGICTWGRPGPGECGRDVLIPTAAQQSKTTTANSVRNVIEHALTTYYQDSSAPSAIARALLAQHKSALLNSAADSLDADMERFFAEWPDEPRNSPYANGRKDAATDLRRRAAEAES